MSHGRTRRGREVFTRATETVELPKVNWRHREDGSRVVSTFLHQHWPNAIHPSDADEFSLDESQGATGVWTPNNPREWERFHRSENLSQESFATRSHRRFKLALQNDPAEKYTFSINPPRDGPDLTDAAAVAEFLTKPFTAHLTKDARHHDRNGRHEDCDNCDGTGRVYDGCSARCQNPHHDAEYKREDACGCPPCDCDVSEHFVDCDECDGSGEVFSASFPRRFPAFLTPSSTAQDALVDASSKADLEAADAIHHPSLVLSRLSGSRRSLGTITARHDIPKDVTRALALPSEDELRVIQLGIEYSQRQGDDDHPDDWHVRRMFSAVEYDDHEQLVETVLEVMKPEMPTVEVADETQSDTDADADPFAPSAETATMPDPDALTTQRETLVEALS